MAMFTPQQKFMQRSAVPIMGCPMGFPLWERQTWFLPSLWPCSRHSRSSCKGQ